MKGSLFLVALLVPWACNSDPEQKPESKTGLAQMPAPTKQDKAASPEPAAALSLAFLKATTRALSTDEMEGRRPGTQGAKRAVAYIVQAMKIAGLEPAGENGGWTQRVPMRAVKTQAATTKLSFTGGKGSDLSLGFGPDVAGGSFADVGPRDIDAPIVFVGYGVTAPEYRWDDYAGVDVKGKIAVVFVGDPPLEDGRFAGSAMTYYGRWTYKFERALEAGAAGCLVIHETEPASYGWNVVENSWSGERFHVVEPDGELPASLDFQGWISKATAEALAVRAGSSLAQWHQQAMKKGFKGSNLPVRLTGTVTTTERRLEDVNVAGKITGETKADEAVLITAHWDHLGMKDATQDTPASDRVFNGALDNASGTAGMLAIAGDLAGRKKKSARTVVFLATTAEEQGLLGSKFYAAHPLVPLENILAVVNLDSMNVNGRTKTIQVMGMGQSELEDVLFDVAQEQGRTLVPDERPEAGSYYRSDHFSFAKRGVPAIYFRGGKDMEDGGTARGEELRKIKAVNYHTVTDEFDEDWSFEGALQDAQAVRHLVARVADAAAPPAWKPTSEFAKLR